MNVHELLQFQFRCHIGLFHDNRLHPFDNHFTQGLHLAGAVHHTPFRGLLIAAGGRKPCNIDQFDKRFTFNGLFLVSSYGSAGTQKIFQLLRPDMLFLFDGWTMIGMQFPMFKSTVGADSDTVAATNAAFIRPGSWCRDRIGANSFDHQCRAFENTDVVALAFFRIYRE